MLKVLVLHGPNLNMLGQRETDVYGKGSLHELNQKIAEQAATLNCQVKCLQSNAEHELIHIIHSAQEFDYLIFNPAAFTHTSIALRDALLAVKIPFIEVHLSNIYAREAFRHVSYFSDIAMGTLSGFGANSYLLALQAIATHS